MNVLVIGGGVVGTATALGFQRLGHMVPVLDKSSECRASGSGLATYTSLPDPRRPLNIVLVCVPESEVPGVIGWLSLQRLNDIPIYIRSSVPPGTCADLQRTLGVHVGHNPEFLREAVAEYEFLNPPAIILGNCCSEHGGIMQELYTPFRVPIYHTTPRVSELTKLAVNGYLACQVSYWNQIKMLADVLGVNSQEIGMLAAHCDERVSVYGSRMHGRAYGGKCLPKDLDQLLIGCKNYGVFSGLLEAIKRINDMVGSSR